MNLDLDQSVNIDSRYSHFKQVARSLWNCGFSQSEELRALSYNLAYQRVVEMLFQIYVFGPTKVWNPGDNPTRFPLSTDDPRRIFVVPKHQHATIQVGSTGPGLGQLYGVTQLIGSDVVRLRFLEPFDWDVLGLRDFLYVCVLIEDWADHPEAVGKVALLESHDVSMWLEDRSHLDPFWHSDGHDDEVDEAQ